MRRFVLAVGMILIAAFAGCVGDSSAPKETATTTAPPPTVSEDAGSVSGMVIDDEQAPVVNAVVALIDANKETSTDKEGKFTFNELEPRAYRLAVQKLGFESVAKSIDVTAGNVAEITLILTPVAVLTAYQDGEILNGFFSSGACISGVVTLRPGAVDPTGAEKSIFDTDAKDAANLKTTVDTMIWDATSAGSATLFSLSHRVDGTQQQSITGKSPIISRLDDPEPKKKDGKINHWTWLGCSSADPTTAVTFVFQQKFTIYVNNFYGEAAPESFTGVPA